MSLVGWCWVGAIVVFLVGVAMAFSSNLVEGRAQEERGCAVAGLGLILMIIMLFVTISVDPGY